MPEDPRYDVDTRELPQALREVFTQFEQDEALTAFLADCNAHPHTWFDMALLFGLSQITETYNAHGILGLYPMHLLSTPQWEALVPIELYGGRLLDIGAGQGFVTEYARPLFSEITAIETASSMVRRLHARGFRARQADITTEPNLFPHESFDVVSILNVLDRCEHPLTLLTHALQFLKPGGVLILSDPLPLEQRVRGNIHAPKEQLGASTGTWEKCLSELYTNVVVPHNLTPLCVSRLPYVYKSVDGVGFEVLDDFVIACRKG